MYLEFQSVLFNCRRDLTDDIATEWLTAGGLNDDDFVAEVLAGASDEALAAEVIREWDLNAEWLAERGIDASDIAEAFARMRE